MEANLKVGPLLEEKQLKAAGVTTGKQFAQYLDKQAGVVGKFPNGRALLAHEDPGCFQASWLNLEEGF